MIHSFFGITCIYLSFELCAEIAIKTYVHMSMTKKDKSSIINLTNFNCDLSEINISFKVPNIKF